MNEPKEKIKKIAKNLEKKGPENAQLIEEDVKEVCYRAREQLMSEEALLELSAPIVIVGDVHGQYDDLIDTFLLNGHPSKKKYLFLGDYVDRGEYSIATIVLLLCYKLLYPTNLYMLRGNHETRFINRVYGFYDECKQTYGIEIWLIFQTVFNSLPLCARIDKRIFCMHGGISKDIINWSTFKLIRRPLEVPDHGVLCDLLWADPEQEVKGFEHSPRGVSYLFGEDAVTEFCRKMGLDMIVRAHQVVQDGYEFFANRRLVTIFSAPFYCGQFDNAGGMMRIDENLQCHFIVRRPKDHKWKKKTPKSTYAKRKEKMIKSQKKLAKRRKESGSLKVIDSLAPKIKYRRRKSSKSKKLIEYEKEPKPISPPEKSITGSMTDSIGSPRTSTGSKKKFSRKLSAT